MDKFDNYFGHDHNADYALKWDSLQHSKSLSKNENAEAMKNKNYELWKQTYEEFYKIPLIYNK